jgi:hypothetical protein
MPHELAAFRRTRRDRDAYRRPVANDIDRLTKLGCRPVLRDGKVVSLQLEARPAPHLEKVLALAPALETLRLGFTSRLTPAALRKLFDVPALARLDEIDLYNGPPRLAVEAFFASSHVRGIKRFRVWDDLAKRFAQAPWPRLEHLTVDFEGTARGRAALEAILATEMPALQGLAINAMKLGAAELAVVTRSPVFPCLTRLEMGPYNAVVGDDAMAVLARAKGRLADLRVSASSFSSKGIATLVAFAKRLASLDLDWIIADTAGFRALGRLRCVRSARIGNQVLAPEALAAFLDGAGASIEELRIPAPNDDHCAAVAAAKMKRLRALRATDGTFGLAGAKALAKVTRLEELQIAQNQDLGDAVAALTRHARLRTLNVEFCGVREAGAKAIAAWPANAAIEKVNLNGNHVLDPDVQAEVRARFPSLHPMAVLGYQHAIRDKKKDEEDFVDEPPPKQRPQPRLPPRRRDWVAGLRELVGRAHFASWDGYVDAKIIARSEALIDRCAQGILALGKDADEKAQRGVLKKCIVAFNRMEDSIHTIEAEDIVSTFEAVVRYTKLAKEDDIADEWRAF